MAIKNADRLKKKLDNICNINLTTPMRNVTKAVHGSAKELCPVDMGNLRNSIHFDVQKNNDSVIGRVYTNCEYAIYVECGTGSRGQGTYPYPIEDVPLVYKDKPWVYWSNKLERYVFTHGHEAQPYMYPALKQNEKYIKSQLGDSIKQSVKGICKGGK